MARYTYPEVQAFRVRQRRAWFAAFAAVMLLAVVAAMAIDAAGAFLLGLLVAMVVALVGFEVLKRWNRARWLRHFPELREHSVSWVTDAR